MRLSGMLCTLCIATLGAMAQDSGGEAWQLEIKGEALQARARLQKAAESANDVGALRAYAEFLDRHRDPAAREVYSKLDQALARSNAPREQRAAVARREAILDLLAGDQVAAAHHIETFRAAGGSGLSLPAAAPPAPASQSYIEIPGPLRSFARMAALSPDLNPEDLLPALARNVVTNGYQAANSNEALEQTEYLKLVVRYLSQARELEKLGGDATRSSRSRPAIPAQTGDLLRVLGYRMRGGCGSDVVLETVNASRAFLTIDSGFPAGRAGAGAAHQPSVHAGLSSDARFRCCTDRNTGSRPRTRPPGEFIDYFISDPSLCRLYLGLSKLDPETADELRKQIPAPQVEDLRARAGLLRRHVPDPRRQGGGSRRRALRESLGRAGRASTRQRRRHFSKSWWRKDDGWLASYFDALARINGPVEGLSDRSGAPEALLHRDSRQGHQPRSGAAGVPVEHRHAAADHASAPGPERQAASPGRSGRLEEPVRRIIRTASTTPS